MKIGILCTIEGDPFVQQFCLWVIQLGHVPIPIYEHDLYKNKLLIMDCNLHTIGVEIHCNDGNKIIFDEIDIFFRRSWHHGIPYTANEEEHYKAQEIGVA